ncbi:MAG: hypothetical protein A2402_00680 [Candidatus Staskawiczbacteria bacterium RIFOXYC1_FULL_37_43]|nr:MAG: hypothetical protein A2813_01570 [Candidatus Staskawiczbacteria bacterium RIFCSPHIGHO2_01_FULL_37_17]OGZ71471.1 MAG: hypothetical protein A2891_00985 [Candidatus Staskawiczbacteria bacterium RIFCSPLOWO2_01_FULL_37_19]OGZ76136.1 MAG: hypothetical protein A2205_03750 [Candidatus Staskawiczbacteria bacterium RIFOXYA1_FULL_37_15]OGZ80104.1 MAG: hypothetical protein A2353_02470 [Candidatus Staskawiczbacteria bacterium RIFOXYB1_FULL_38_37]OGZ81742.1 MAG: hypothetical protein A2402_00680 [Cand
MTGKGEQEMETQRIRGVALIVQNPKGEILILQEYETKPRFGKYCGMFSVPMETSEPDESDYHAIVRLSEEELPGLDFLFDGVLQARIGSYQIVSHVWVNLYSVRATNARLPDSKDSKNKEVGNYRWTSPKKALNLWLRQGAREMINDFIDNKKGALCKCCCPPHEK